MRINIKQISELTGFDRETISKLLKELDFEIGKHNSKEYESVYAFELIYKNYRYQNKSSSYDENGYNPSQEKARLDRKKADLVELQYYEKLGSLVPIENVRNVWSSLILSVRSHLLAIPSKLKSIPKQIRVQISAELEKSLSELQEINESEYYTNGNQPVKN